MYIYHIIQKLCTCMHQNEMFIPVYEYDRIKPTLYGFGIKIEEKQISNGFCFKSFMNSKSPVNHFV